MPTVDGDVGTALRGGGRGIPGASPLGLLDLLWRGAVKVVALTAAIVTAVVAAFLLVEAGRVAAHAESLRTAVVFVEQSLGLALAVALLLSSFSKGSAGRLVLAALAVAALILS